MIKLNRIVVISLLRACNVIKEAEQKGARIVIGSKPTMKCWDDSVQPAQHETIIPGYGWQVYKGSELIRQGYITDSGRVIEKKVKGVTVDPSEKGDRVQWPLFFGGYSTSPDERIYRELTINNFVPTHEMYEMALFQEREVK